MKKIIEFRIKKIIKIILDFLFPESCLICEKTGNTICDLCLAKIKSYKSDPKEKLKENLNLKDNISWVTNSLDYQNKNLRKVIFSLKYFYVKSVSKYLAKICYEDFYNLLDKNYLEDYIFSPIPISSKRLKERSYNQSELILKEIIIKIKENKNIDLEKNIYLDFILKNKNTIKFSHTHSHTERENLIKNAFVLNNKYENISKNKKIILIDDITTTGATFYEARETLIKNNFKKENIFGYAVAH